MGQEPCCQATRLLQQGTRHTTHAMGPAAPAQLTNTQHINTAPASSSAQYARPAPRRSRAARELLADLVVDNLRPVQLGARDGQRPSQGLEDGVGHGIVVLRDGRLEKSELKKRSRTMRERERERKKKDENNQYKSRSLDRKNNKSSPDTRFQHQQSA